MLQEKDDIKNPEIIEEKIVENTEKEAVAEVLTTGIEETKKVKKQKNKYSEQHSELYFESEAQAKRYEITRRIKLFFIYFFLGVAALFLFIG